MHLKLLKQIYFEKNGYELFLKNKELFSNLKDERHNPIEYFFNIIKNHRKHESIIKIYRDLQITNFYDFFFIFINCLIEEGLLDGSANELSIIRKRIRNTVYYKETQKEIMNSNIYIINEFFNDYSNHDIFWVRLFNHFLFKMQFSYNKYRFKYHFKNEKLNGLSCSSLKIELYRIKYLPVSIYIYLSHKSKSSVNKIMDDLKTRNLSIDSARLIFRNKQNTFLINLKEIYDNF